MSCSRMGASISPTTCAEEAEWMVNACQGNFSEETSFVVTTEERTYTDPVKVKPN